MKIVKYLVENHGITPTKLLNNDRLGMMREMVDKRLRVDG